MLERLGTNNTEFFDGKKGACCGVFQMVVAGRAKKEQLRDVINLLRNNASHPQVALILRTMTRWAQDHKLKGVK